MTAICSCDGVHDCIRELHTIQLFVHVMESTTVSAHLPKYQNMMSKGFLLLIVLSHSEGSSVCIDDQYYECKDMGITKCLPKSERCSTAACDKPLPIEKPACRKHCSASESWCEERGECIERREVCDCGVDKIYCSKHTYSCESRQGIIHSNIFNVCKDGTCRGNCSQYNQVHCQEGYFKCGDGCLAFSEIAEYRNCEGLCILANDTCYRNSDINENLSSFNYHYFWTYIAGSFILSCFIFLILYLLGRRQNSGGYGDMKMSSTLKKIVVLTNSFLSNRIEPPFLQIFLTVLYSADCYLHIPVAKLYYEEYLIKNASPWFFFLSATTFIVTVFIIQVIVWCLFFTKSSCISSIIVSITLCLVSPAIWLASPILLLAVRIGRAFGLHAQSDLLKKLKFFVNINSLITTTYQGLPQLGLSIVYLSSYSSEQTSLLVGSCILGLVYQIIFWGGAHFTHFPASP